MKIVCINAPAPRAELVMSDLFDVSKETILVTGASQGWADNLRGCWPRMAPRSRWRRDHAAGLKRLALHDRQRGDGRWRVFADVMPKRSVQRHCEERKRRSNPVNVAWPLDCFASLAMTVILAEAITITPSASRP
jgi:hypothetical protein